jgi:uncharacterized protein involved in cysteine biosynthesis
MTLFSALFRALRDLAQPRVLAVMFVPMLVTILLWSVLAWFFWDDWSAWFKTWFDATGVAAWLHSHGATWASSSLTFLVVLATVLPAMFITVVLITELVAMPIIVSVVSRTHPELAKHKGGTMIGSIGNASAAVLIFVVLWLLTLPLWLTGIGAAVLPALNSAYLNQRLFRYDALAEHATREEYQEIVTRSKGGLYGLGLLLALLYYIPGVNLVAPVVSGLAFTHYCLGSLARLRGARAATVARWT